MKYDQLKYDTHSLYTISTDKFKSVHMELIFRTPVSKENLTYLALLSNMLIENTKKFPTKKLLSRHKCDLYNLSVNAVNTRVGNLILTHFVIDSLDPKYIGQNAFEDAIKLLFDIVLDPNINNGEFEQKTFDRLKENLGKEIEALKEDPKQSCILSSLKEIDEEDPRSFNTSGDLECLASITPKKLYNFYVNFIENSPRDIYVVGNIDAKHIDKIVKKYAKFKSITKDLDDIYIEPYKIKKPLVKESKSILSQTSLSEIYTFHDLTKKERDYVVPLFNMIWGSGSLESKLYKLLREEHSLCYNVSTMYQKYDNNLILYTAIDDESTSLAIKLIKKTLDEMQKGIIDAKNLESAKNMMITSLHLVLDNPNRLIDNYLFRNLVGLEAIEDRIDGIRSITMDDIMEVGKKIKLVMTYKVRGE